MKAALPPNEEARLAAVAAYRSLDANSTAVYDDFTKIASYIADVPIALITLIDKDKQVFYSKVGLEALENSRDVSFCAHAILTPHSTLTVEDATKDIRFADNPLVMDDLKVRFYCGVPLVTDDDQALGTLCVIDRRPRILDKRQEDALKALARRVMDRLEIQKVFHDLEKAIQDPTAVAGPTSGVDDLTRQLGNMMLKRREALKTEFK